MHKTEVCSALSTEFQGPCHEPQILDKSVNNTLRHVKFSCNFASLPLEEQCRALTLEICTNLHHIDPKKWKNLKLIKILIRKLKLVLRVVFFKRKCDCLIECSICKQRRSETVACECNMQHAKLSSVKIDKSLSGGWEVPSGQVDCISAFLDLQRKISS